jgi:two-component system sensor histidine kinase UhpB
VAAALALAFSPATVSTHVRIAEGVVLALGTLVVITVNLLLVRRVFEPLELLTALMRRVDLRDPGRRLAVDRADPEVADLCHTFNAMLDRLEQERRSSGRHALAAQEAELMSLAAQASDRGGLRVRPRLAPIPTLPRELDLAIFRIAQESLTNVARHAGARNVSLDLAVEPTTLTLRVRDDGRGITAEEAAGRSMGLGGMHERALLVGGKLSVAQCAEGGTEVRLVVPLPAGG